jgi:hypothetical protein
MPAPALRCRLLPERVSRRKFSGASAFPIERRAINGNDAEPTMNDEAAPGSRSGQQACRGAGGVVRE